MNGLAKIDFLGFLLTDFARTSTIRMEGGTLKSLPKAFFIYDRVQEETADEDIILYFHPDTVPEHVSPA